VAAPAPTFDDEFNTLDLSGGPWKPAISWAPNGSTDATLSSWSMNPAWGPTSAADANVFSDTAGVLSIAVKPTPADVSPSSVGNQPFLAGQLTTAGSFSQLYGYFEMNAKLDSAAGTNAAFWLLPADGSWPPELDAEEVLGSSPTTLVNTAHSQAGGSHTANPHWSNVADTSAGFHTYGVDWEADKITWYFDGKQTAQEATPGDMHKPMFMLLSNMAGSSSSWIGQPAAGTNTSMQVNWVHAYASNPYANGAAPSSPAGSASSSNTAQPAPAATITTAGGTTAAVSTLTLHLSEDAWQGNAQFLVSVDGKALNAATEVTALHKDGSVQDFAFAGSFGAGPHDVAVSFLNDAYGGSAATDRNLYVNAIDLDSQHKNVGAVLYGNGTQHFSIG